MFCVYYFPKFKDDPRSECFDIQERLMDVLELIEVDGDLVRGTEMKGEIKDEMLYFFVDYNMFTRKEKEVKAEMKEISGATAIKKS